MYIYIDIVLLGNCLNSFIVVRVFDVFCHVISK